MDCALEILCYCICVSRTSLERELTERLNVVVDLLCCATSRSCSLFAAFLSSFILGEFNTRECYSELAVHI